MSLEFYFAFVAATALLISIARADRRRSFDFFRAPEGPRV